MGIKTKQSTILKLPLADIKFLYQKQNSKKLIFEVNMESLKKINQPDTIDDMVAEARLEYLAGKTKGFTNTKALMSYLKS